MWSIIGSIFKNPIFSYVADKTIGEVKHYLEVRKIERGAEIEALKSVQISQVESSEKSWKDEWLTLVFTFMLVAHFIPALQPFMTKGWELIKQAPDMFWYILAGIVSGSFGINIIDKYKK
jgi:hypothetical protein